jgi:hypothetical protein
MKVNFALLLILAAAALRNSLPRVAPPPVRRGPSADCKRRRKEMSFRRVACQPGATRAEVLAIEMRH